jgi:hypothetical protein
MRAGWAGETAAFQGFLEPALGKGDQLMEGLPMIRPGAVDICRPVMVRYSVIYGVTR